MSAPSLDRFARSARRLADTNAAPWCLAFAAALSTSRVEPYFSNQETYLAHALAVAEYGRVLQADWFVGTLDPVPVFTVLARSLIPLGAWAMWLVNAALGALLLSGMGRISAQAEANGTARTRERTTHWVGFFALFWVLVPGLAHSLLFDGIAEQRAYAEYLQPSNAGVLLVFAVSRALDGRALAAVLVAAASAWIHPTYALSVLIFAGGLALVELAEKAPKSAWRALASAVLAIAPPVALSLRTFAPVNAALAEQASRILVFERLPHHALVSAWLGPQVALRIAPLVAAIALSRGRAARLCSAWLALTLVATVLVALSGRPALLLLFPWRATVWLIPASAALLVGSLGRFVPASRRRWLFALVLPLVIVCMIKFARPESHGGLDETQGIALARAIPMSEREKWTLLVPMTWEGVRLNAPAAVYIDFKSHPYKDTEVIAWSHRLALDKAVYAAAAEGACTALHTLLTEEPRIGFVLAPSDQLSRCRELAHAEAHEEGVLYRVLGRTAPSE